MIILRQKEFHVDMATGQFISTADLLAKKKTMGGTAKDALATLGKERAAADAAATAKRAAERAKNIANPGAAAARAAQSKVGFKQGFKNSWGKMSTGGKAAVIGGGLVTGGLALKGLFGGNKKED